MDNQRLIIWGLFAVLAYLTWQTWMQDYAPRPPVTSEGEATLADDEAALPDALPSMEDGDEGLPSVDTLAPAVDAGVTDEAATGPGQADEEITVLTDVAEFTISTRGGTILLARMLKYPVHKDEPDLKVLLFDPSPGNFGQLRSWLRSKDGATEAPGPGTLYESPAREYVLGSDDELVVPMKHTNDAGVTFEKRYRFRRGAYRVDLEQRVTNGSESAWRGDQVTQLLTRSQEMERSMFDVESFSFDGPLLFDGNKAEKLKRDDLLDDGPANITSTNGWYASIQHHFLTAIVPAPGSTNIFQVRVDGNRLTASVIGAPQTVPAGEAASFERSLFIGPKMQSQLEELHPRLKLSVDYGWLTILSQPMFWLLAWVHKYVGNWGWSIIAVTILIKLAFYKLTEASGRSMAKMREIQPRMKALQDRYKDDRQALSQAMMELYKREKINPAAGCLPILVQMPFFLAFYWVLVESVEMRQAPFALWITDLSSRDPYFILPLIMGAAMLVQQKLNPAPADPVQAKVMQIMPIMFTVFFAFFPSGLVLYWVTNTVLSIAQQWHINKVVAEEGRQRKKGGKKKTKKDG